MVNQSTEKALLKGSIVVIVIQHGGMQQLKVMTTTTTKTTTKNVFVRQQPVVSFYRFIVTNV
jgi:hypothetical protein